jgi:predicted O-methyltransferase YrrM
MGEAVLAQGAPNGSDRQLATMREMCAPFVDESIGNPHFKQATERRFGPGFGYIEARALHGVIRSLKPRRVIEVGSGVSTYCIQQASALNANDCKLTCIEPHPSDWLKTANVTLLAAPVQSIPREVFETLGAGDFLFVDSSHAVKTGGDVNYLILEILPMLRPGVTVHFHDITLPYDYNPDTLETFIHPQETALLHAFLIGNAQYEVLFCMSLLHHDRPQELKEIFPDYAPRQFRDGLSTDSPQGYFPSSLYLRAQP